MEQYNLSKAGYLADDNTVAQMARDYAEARASVNGVRGMYLQVLVAHSKEVCAKARKQTQETAIECVKGVHDRLYAVVLAAITTPDVIADDKLAKEERQRRSLERNRRSNFARTAKSEIMGYLEAGGSLGQLNPATVSKEELRDYAKQQREEQTPEVAAVGLETRLERVLKAMVEEDRERAIEFVDELHTKLMLIVAKPLTDRTTRRGDLTLHPTH